MPSTDSRALAGFVEQLPNTRRPDDAVVAEHHNGTDLQICLHRNEIVDNQHRLIDGPAPARGGSARRKAGWHGYVQAVSRSRCRH
jgi:hypothetical protein